jgi:hypothetical protein
MSLDFSMAQPCDVNALLQSRGIIVESQEEDGHENDGFNSLLNRLAWPGPLSSQVIYTK